MNRLVDFDASVCHNLAEAETREWLVTNGMGGYAAGTLAGHATRRYHGLLIAATNPPVERTLLLARLDESVEYQDKVYDLYHNHWSDGTLEPHGYRQLERFFLEQAIPTWVFACGAARLEKQIWMEPGENTSYIRYTYTRGQDPLCLVIKAITNHRDHHQETQALAAPVRVEPVAAGLQVTYPDQAPFYLLQRGGQAFPAQEWYQGYYYALEAYRGLPAEEDQHFSGLFTATLQPGESLTLVASTRPDVELAGEQALARRQAYEAALLSHSRLQSAPAWIRQLCLAADQFIVRRALPGQAEGRSVIAGYPWFTDWGRDTMIALPGLTLVTGRYDLAAQILRTFGHYIDHGMLPNRFPDEGGAAEYNTVDATLWYFEALRTYLEATSDLDLIAELYPSLVDIIAWHQRGTRYQIRMDPRDGLIYAGEPGVQLTWMDAKVGDWVVTPRIGKPVEINALWYHALCVMADFAGLLGQDGGAYRNLAQQVAASFERFWNPELGCCFDVLDGPQGNDPAIRPNQLMAVSLSYTALTAQQQRSLVGVCQRQLLSGTGLRSLSPQDPAFIGTYGGDQRQRDAAYHQGTSWSWLIGPFVRAHLRAYGDPQQAEKFLEPFQRHLSEHGLGTVSEIFDGRAPHTARGCFSQAWGVAEVLHAWHVIRKYGSNSAYSEAQELNP
ncbi:MAG: glycogen debranching enzyme family protein [Anaerolineales bacterium]|nr:glycogen debranching enzyme family protein [Anaerolineales bacterium]